MLQNRHPDILATIDSTDPGASGSALNALQELATQVFNPLFTHGLSYLKPTPPPFKLIVHMKYNPEQITQYNIVPGLMGVILTMTLVMNNPR